MPRNIPSRNIAFFVVILACHGVIQGGMINDRIESSGYLGSYVDMMTEGGKACLQEFDDKAEELGYMPTWPDIESILVEYSHPLTRRDGLMLFYIYSQVQKSDEIKKVLLDRIRARRRQFGHIRVSYTTELITSAPDSPTVKPPAKRIVEFTRNGEKTWVRSIIKENGGTETSIRCANGTEVWGRHLQHNTSVSAWRSTQKTVSQLYHRYNPIARSQYLSEGDELDDEFGAEDLEQAVKGNAFSETTLIYRGRKCYIMGSFNWRWYIDVEDLSLLKFETGIVEYDEESNQYRRSSDYRKEEYSNYLTVDSLPLIAKKSRYSIIRDGKTVHEVLTTISDIKTVDEDEEICVDVEPQEGELVVDNIQNTTYRAGPDQCRQCTKRHK